MSLGLDYGKGARIEDVSDWKFEGEVAMRDTVDGIPSNTATKMQNGALLAVYDATRQTIDNRDVSSSAVLVEGNSVVLINLSFEPAPIDFSMEGPIVQFVAIRYFDNDGGERLRLVPLGTLSSAEGGRLYNPAPPSARSRLLPYEPNKRATQ